MNGVNRWFIFSQAEKKALLKGVAEQILTGQVVKVRTSRDAETEFSPNIDSRKTFDEICEAIANSPDFDPTDPIQAQAALNGRASTTRVRFG